MVLVSELKLASERPRLKDGFDSMLYLSAEAHQHRYPSKSETIAESN